MPELREEEEHLAMNHAEKVQIGIASKILTQLFEPQHVPRAVPTSHQFDALAIARALKENFAKREEVLPILPACNPGWRILIELYIARRERVRVSITDITLLTNLAGATSLRWLKLLDDGGLVIRQPDINDRRRFWLCLTDRGLGTVSEVLENMAAQFNPVFDFAYAM